VGCAWLIIRPSFGPESRKPGPQPEGGHIPTHRIARGLGGTDDQAANIRASIRVGTFPPGHPAPPLHVHPHTDEAFYVADGDATFQLGDREVPVTAGGLVFVPRGMAHTVWNSGDRPVRGLILVSPGGAEHVFVPAEAG
jgi:mannose-6-phosphate isomerase-like protein (cupin superfamily)